MPCYDNRDHYTQRDIDELTALLCEAGQLYLGERSEPSADLRKWWADHAEWDSSTNTGDRHPIQLGNDPSGKDTWVKKPPIIHISYERYENLLRQGYKLDVPAAQLSGYRDGDTVFHRINSDGPAYCPVCDDYRTGLRVNTPVELEEWKERWR